MNKLYKNRKNNYRNNNYYKDNYNDFEDNYEIDDFYDYYDDDFSDYDYNDHNIGIDEMLGIYDSDELDEYIAENGFY